MTPERKLPDGWRWVRFGDVVRQVKDRVDPETAGLERYVAGEHMDTDDLRVRRWGDVGEGYLGPAFHMRFRPGQVLYGSRRTYLRKVAVPDFEGICANTTFVVESATEDLLPEFLPFVMTTEAFHEHSIKQSKGSVNPYINFKDLTWYEFALPPVPEQRRIVELLASAFQVHERYRQVTDRATSALDAVRRDLITEDREGESRLLGEVVDLAMGRVYPSGDYGESGVPLLRPGNISPSGYLEWPPSSSVRLPEHYAADQTTVMLSPGDVVMNLTAQSMDDGFLGRVCLARDGDESIVNQRIGRLRSISFPNEYLFRVLQDQGFRRHVERIAKGSKIKHLYWQDLARFEVPCPSDARAREVVERTRAAESAIAASVKAIETTSLVTTTLAESLMVGDL